MKNKFQIKDLRIIKNRELHNLLLIDNSPGVFGECVDNGIAVRDFLGDHRDTELKELEKYLMKGINQSNIA